MIFLVGFVLIASAILVGAWLARRMWRQRQRQIRLVSAEREIACAVSDNRLSRATGEALLQHLEGLRRECARGGGN